MASDHPRGLWFKNKRCSPLRIEVSLAFYRDEPRQLLDPAAPSVTSRMEAIRFLRKENLPVHVRIDPLFPRDPLSSGKMMQDFGLPDVQPMADLEALCRFCSEVGVRHVIYSVAKITRPRTGVLSAIMQRMRRVYEHYSPESSLAFRGGAWRLPDNVAADLVNPFLELCRRHAIDAKACKANLISTP
jgi:DNA repair photolyase